MNILITCHKPPGFGHTNLFELNTTAYKANKTRKNTIRNLREKGNTIYYIDTHYTDIPDTTPRWFSKWESIPDNSMDILWGHNCPIYGPFSEEDLHTRLNYDTSEEAGFLDESDGFLRDVLTHGKRILKDGGKIVLPFLQTWDGWISDSDKIALIARIINMEVIPDFLYKISVINALSKRHTTNLENRFILNTNNFTITKNGNNRVLHLDKAYKFLVFEKP